MKFEKKEPMIVYFTILVWYYQQCLSCFQQRNTKNPPSSEEILQALQFAYILTQNIPQIKHYAMRCLHTASCTRITCGTDWWQYVMSCADAQGQTSRNRFQRNSTPPRPLSHQACYASGIRCSTTNSRKGGAGVD